MLSAYNGEGSVFATFASGVAGYLTKDEATEHMIEAVRGVARGDAGRLSRRVTDVVVGRAKPHVPGFSGLPDPLTTREHRIVNGRLGECRRHGLDARPRSWSSRTCCETLLAREEDADSLREVLCYGRVVVAQHDHCVAPVPEYLQV